MQAFYFPTRRFPKEESEIGKLLAEIEFLENYFIQQISLAVARRMNGLVDYRGQGDLNYVTIICSRKRPL